MDPVTFDSSNLAYSLPFLFLSLSLSRFVHSLEGIAQTVVLDVQNTDSRSTRNVPRLLHLSLPLSLASLLYVPTGQLDFTEALQRYKH